MMKLYYGVGACSLASHIALEEAGAEYEAIRVDLKSGQQRAPGYLELNPKGRVPTLITDRGVITETPAILAYIAQTHRAANLAPLDDPFAFAELQAFNSYLCSTVHVSHAHGARGGRWSDDPAVVKQLKVKVTQNMGDQFETIEKKMFKGPWVMGKDFSVGDAYLYTMANWLGRDGVDISRFPKVADHFKRMEARPAVARVLADERKAA
jgi:glutathione S-transferase